MVPVWSQFMQSLIQTLRSQQESLTLLQRALDQTCSSPDMWINFFAGAHETHHSEAWAGQSEGTASSSAGPISQLSGTSWAHLASPPNPQHSQPVCVRYWVALLLTMLQSEKLGDNLSNIDQRKMSPSIASRSNTMHQITSLPSTISSDLQLLLRDRI